MKLLKLISLACLCLHSERILAVWSEDRLFFKEPSCASSTAQAGRPLRLKSERAYVGEIDQIAARRQLDLFRKKKSEPEFAAYAPAIMMRLIERKRFQFARDMADSRAMNEYQFGSDELGDLLEVLIESNSDMLIGLLLKVPGRTALISEDDWMGLFDLALESGHLLCLKKMLFAPQIKDLISSANQADLVEDTARLEYQGHSAREWVKEAFGI